MAKKAKKHVEAWKPVIGYEGKYQVSDRGRIRRINHLKPRNNRYGYPYVVLVGEGRKRETIQVHKLVTEAFIGPRPESLQVNHIDANKENNRADNLEYVSHLENIRHAIKLGLSEHYYRRGEAKQSAKLTEEQVLEIRKLAGTMSQGEIARRYNTQPSNVWSIINRKTWKHLP